MSETATITVQALAGAARRDTAVSLRPQAEALRGQAQAATQDGRLDEAERLLAACLALAPDFAAARRDLAHLLLGQRRLSECLAQADRLLDQDPERPAHLLLKAAALARSGRPEAAIPLHEAALVLEPANVRGWMGLGHALKTVGRAEEAVAAYRQVLELAPHFGEAWWSLANLKTFRFTAQDTAAMGRSLGAMGLTDEDRVQLHYALGKADEDGGRYAESFGHYAQGAALRRGGLDHSPGDMTEHVRRSKALLSPGFFAARAGHGCDAPDPIFVVGLPRAGSTLVEQILASHSQVEGTQELPDVMRLARRLGGGEAPIADGRYPESLTDLSDAALQALGCEYLAAAAVYRRTGRPFFVDKMPNNFAHVGLIHLMLPNARIIDVRRHPLACGFSVFKQHFAQGQAFSYDLAEIGRYYADYTDLMAHLDAVLPGRVHRVTYEDLVADPDREVRRLLIYCGLEYEADCLNFHANGRAVHTPSAEQVRQPIFTGALDHWRHFEPWLEPLKAALGPRLVASSKAPAGRSKGRRARAAPG